MPLQGPIIIVSDAGNLELAEAIKAYDQTPIMESTWASAADTIRSGWPAAVVIDEPATAEHVEHIVAINQMLELSRIRDCYVPVLMRVGKDFGPAIPTALPISAGAKPARIIAQTNSAQRVRRLEGTVKKRAAALKAEGGELFEPEQGDPLDDASVLVCGRGKTYPELCTVVGERLAMIGSLSVESAARHLTSRPLDGIFIGPGFGPPTVNAFLTALSEDRRFRDLPVALMGGVPVSVDTSLMPNFEQFTGKPADVLAWMLPLVRLHAYEARLQRELKAVEAGGLLDPRTALFTSNAFAEEFKRAIKDARLARQPLSVARFWFPKGTDQRVILDVARQASRIRRSLDFASLAPDGSILLALPNTKLRAAHVAARRFANTFKHTLITAGSPGGRIETHIALATLLPNDTADTILGRVFETMWIPEAAE